MIALGPAQFKKIIKLHQIRNIQNILSKISMSITDSCSIVLHLLLAESTVNNHFDYNYDQCFGLKEEGYCDDHYVF